MKLKNLGKRTIIIFLIIAFTLILPACKQETAVFHGTGVQPTSAAPELILVDHNGAEFSLEEQRGKVVLIFFGFTHCPDICPLTMMKLKKVSDSLSRDEDNVRILFVTVDPERDDRQNLHDFINTYDSRFIGLRGSVDELKTVYEAWGIYRQADKKAPTASDYLVNHTNSILIIDKHGNWRLNHTDVTKADNIVHDVHILLQE